MHLSRYPHLSTLTTALLFAGFAPATQAADKDARLDTVTVISTGVRGQARTVADSPAPIDVINSEQLLKTGRAELSEAISRLLPSFNFGTNIAGYNSVTRPLSNRSLGPAYTLVLVNGKRRHNGAVGQRGNIDNSGANAVDIDLIPVSAVDHIEILKDSAAAQYGSDAVAGVINIILKSSASGGHVETSYGQLYSGQGETIKVAGDQGFKLGESGFVHLSADARKRGDAAWNDKADSSVRAFRDPVKEAAWDRVAIKNGDPEIKAFNVAYNAELPLDALTLYSYATYGERDAEAYNYFRLPTGTASVPELFPDGYYPLNNIKDRDYQFLFGGKGERADWHWDLSTTYGRNNIHHSSDFNINPSLGTATPTSFDNLATFRFEQWVNNFDLTRRYDSLFGLTSPVQVSAGLEHRWERFSTFAGEPAAYLTGNYPAASGAQAAVTLRPEDEVSLIRNNYAAYLDLGFDLTDRWFLDLAGRVEHYDDDSGNTFGLKLNSRYELTDSVAVRGTVGTGFRAPSLTQIGYTVADNRVATDVNGNVVPAVTRLTPSDSSLAAALGGDALKPEKSRNLGLGLTWQPAPRTSITADAYLIDIDDRITLTSNIYDQGNGVITSILQSQGVARGTWVNYYTNAYDTRTKGLDIVADHSTDFGAWGDVRWSLAFNWNKTSIEDVRDTPASLAGSGVTLVGRDREGDLTVASPETKWILGANWKVSDFAVNLQTTRFGSVKTLAVNPSGDRSFGAKWITDLDVAYTFFDQLTLSVGATNLFDVRPDKHAVYSPLGLAPYGNPPFHPGGGYWYSKIAYDF
ncbi:MULTISPECIES: TonB-dependent receptor plug domain-containing protein [unclassified Pseudomonas]|uniref:TonB-dependent receptor plug domain-containing protein n=1 Tax=unclassified Pseudomonas TaxID=196821 RepID=UPI0021C6D379|nr:MULTISPECIES: TonB-dependent receptor [unclassified Pseudomonas]MCU1734455.1 TonB-dependent receptor [Pseudomonas sp. 20P_3.2_Bac4]MCU1745568.1 TonB-dependent receptor [Pseudomonas sp. 20P_3.2_Bac5]